MQYQLSKESLSAGKYPVYDSILAALRLQNSLSHLAPRYNSKTTGQAVNTRPVILGSTEFDSQLL
jgi:hypothetical protein